MVSGELRDTRRATLSKGKRESGEGVIEVAAVYQPGREEQQRG